MKRGEFDGVGYKVHDDRFHVIMSRGQFLFGRVEYVTHRQNMLEVWTTHRRRKGTVVRRFKPMSYLKPWEEVRPARRMLAVEGRVVEIAPPEEVT